VATCNYYLQAYFNQALAYKEMDNIDSAISIYGTMLDINPKVSRIYTLRGLCHYSKGHYKKSEADFAVSIEADKIELDAIFGLYRSMMKTKKLKQVLPILSRINHQMTDTLKTIKEKYSPELETMKLNPETGCNLLRVEAKEKMIKKLKKDTIDVLQMSLRFTSDLYFLSGEFSTGLKTMSELTLLNPPTKNSFMESLLTEFGKEEFNRISQEVKRLSWEFCCRLCNKTTYKKSLSSLLSTSTTPFIKLSTKEEQLYFISCFSYFYLSLYNTRNQSYQILEDLKKWIYCTPPEQELKIMSSSFYHQNMNRLCSHPFVLVHILEIFKKTKNNITLRLLMLKTLLSAIYERRSVNEMEFENFVTRLIRKTVATTLPSPYFLIEH